MPILTVNLRYLWDFYGWISIEIRNGCFFYEIENNCRGLDKHLYTSEAQIATSVPQKHIDTESDPQKSLIPFTYIGYRLFWIFIEWW